MSIRERIHTIIDDLSESDLETVEKMLHRFKEDPVVYAFENAPIDDEPESEEDRRAIEEADEDIERGDLIPHAQVKRELGL